MGGGGGGGGACGFVTCLIPEQGPPLTTFSSFGGSSQKTASDVQCCFTTALTVQTVLGTGAQDVHLFFHTVPQFSGSDVPAAQC